MDVDNLEKELLLDMECPLCAEYVFPPIRQCQTGHNFCDSCFNKIRRCPTCKAPKSKARCYTLEAIHARLTFPCRFFINGCTFADKGKDIRKHEMHCSFVMKKCPLRFHSNCSWEGSAQKIVKHCEDRHPANIYFEERQKLVCSQFGRNLITRKYDIIFSVHQELFRCSWELNEDTRMMTFAVYLLSKSDNQKERKTFRYKIVFLSGNTDAEALSMTAPCMMIEDDTNDRFLKSYFLTAQYDFVKEYCNESGDLNYLVQIQDNTAISNLLGINLIR